MVIAPRIKDARTRIIETGTLSSQTKMTIKHSDYAFRGTWRHFCVKHSVKHPGADTVLCPRMTNFLRAPSRRSQAALCLLPVLMSTLAGLLFLAQPARSAEPEDV